MNPSLDWGRDARLTLDVVVQHYLEHALETLYRNWQPESAVGIVLDPRTGHVLAMANRPVQDERTGALSLNFAVQGRYTPGSLFKPFTVAQALRIGVLQVDERIPMPCQKTYVWPQPSRVHRRTVHDTHGCGECDGRGTAELLLQESSNTGSAELAWRLTPTGMKDLVANLGLDEPTGVELGGEVVAGYGRPKREWNALYPGIGLGFGQGLAVSPIRMACAFAAFARHDARIVEPTLIPGRGGPHPTLPPVCASRAHLELVRRGLAGCVDAGTGERAFKGCAIPVAGKTGTAVIRGTPWEIAGFIGFAPRDCPRLLVLVQARVRGAMRHNGLKPYGGNVAAPAVRRVIERTMAYYGDETDGEGR